MDFPHFAGGRDSGRSLAAQAPCGPHRQLLAEYRRQGYDDVLPAKPPIPSYRVRQGRLFQPDTGGVPQHDWWRKGAKRSETLVMSVADVTPIILNGAGHMPHLRGSRRDLQAVGDS